MNFINKHFRKSKCIKVIYFAEGKKQITYYVIPDGKNITLKDHEKTFELNDKEFFIDPKGFITYVFSYNRVETVDPNNAETLGTTTPFDLETAIESKVASEILQATRNKADINIILLIVMAIIVIGFIALWYTTDQRFNELTDSLKPLLEVLN
jgi:hypothetical protein